MRQSRGMPMRQRGPVHADDGGRTRVTRTGGNGRAGDSVRYEEDEVAAGAWQVQLPEALSLARDRVRWGPILAGVMTALTSLVLLSLLGLAIGLTTVNAGTVAAQGGPPREVGQGAAIWGALTGIVAFLMGGYVAGRTAAVFSRGWGALNGFLVVVVAVPVLVSIAGQGFGLVLGTLGLTLGELQQVARDVQGIDVARTAEAARNAAWGTLIALGLGLGAGALGGSLGTRRGLPLGHAMAGIGEE
jgi:hypothetical protein